MCTVYLLLSTVLKNEFHGALCKIDDYVSPYMTYITHRPLDYLEHSKPIIFIFKLDLHMTIIISIGV